MAGEGEIIKVKVVYLKISPFSSLTVELKVDLSKLVFTTK